MAQLNTRGTLTRGRWDFFERTNGVAFVYGSVTTGPIGCYFVNNGTGGLAIDLYAVASSSSAQGLWDTYILLPPITGSALTPTESTVSCIKPDEATPAGAVGMFTALTSPTRHLLRESEPTNYVEINPVAGVPFYTLPPMWGIAIFTNPTGAQCEMSMTVWYQEVLDNIAPAR